MEKMKDFDLEKMDERTLNMIVALMREPYHYLLQAMLYAKEAVKNGGKADVMPVTELFDMTSAEGEMFHKDFLPLFGELENYDYNGEQCKVEDLLPLTFTPNAKGVQLGQLGLEIEQKFADMLPSKKEILKLTKKQAEAIEAKRQQSHLPGQKAADEKII